MARNITETQLVRKIERPELLLGYVCDAHVVGAQVARFVFLSVNDM